MLGHLNVTFKLGDIRKALEHEEACSKEAMKLADEQIRANHSLERKLDEATETIKRINAELAAKDDECCRLRKELADAPKRPTLTDEEIGLMKFLRECARKSSSKIRAAMYAHAADAISSKGDI